MSYQLIAVVSGNERPTGWTIRIAGVTWTVPEGSDRRAIVIPRPVVRNIHAKAAA